MSNEVNPVRTIILAENRGSKVIIRAKRENEPYPTHTPKRILVDSTVHLVKRCDVMEMVLALKFEPEQAWKKCPRCQKKDWSVWMPVPIQVHDVWDKRVEHPQIYTVIKWYVLCFHCASIVANHDTNPYGLSDIREYIYDPADDIKMNLWAEVPRRQHGKK